MESETNWNARDDAMGEKERVSFEENKETDDEKEEQMIFEPMREEIFDEPVLKFVFEDSPKNVIEVAKEIFPVVELDRSGEHVVTVSPQANIEKASKNDEVVSDLSFETKTKKTEKATETVEEEKGEPSAVNRSDEISRILQSRAIVVLERCIHLEPSSFETPTKEYCQTENEKDDENNPLAEVKKTKQKTVEEKAEESELGFSDGARKCRQRRRKLGRDRRLKAKRLASRKWRAMKKCISSSKAYIIKNYKMKDEMKNKHKLPAKTKEENHKELPETSVENEFRASDEAKKCRPKRRRKPARETPEHREKRLAAKRLATRKWRAMKRCVSSSGVHKVNDVIDDKNIILAKTEGKKQEKENEAAEENELGVSREDKNCEQRRSLADERLESRKWRTMELSVKLSKHNSTVFDRKLQRRAIVVLERCTEPSSSEALMKNAKVESETNDKISLDVECEEYVTPETSTEKQAASETIELNVEPRNLSLSSPEVSTETPKQQQQLEERSSYHNVDEKKHPRVRSYVAEKSRRRRAKETPEQYEKRLKTDLERTRKRIANETPEQRQRRLEISAECKRKRKAIETPEQRQRRLENVAKSKRKRLANETPEEREKRLAIIRESARRLKERKSYETDETPESLTFRESESTLDVNNYCSHSCNIMVFVNEEDGEYYPPEAERARNEVANETLDPREMRRLAINLARRNRRANETPEQRQKRLAVRYSARDKRLANETPEQRQKRLTARYLARDKRLANETPEEREQSLEADKMRQRMKRLRNPSSYKDESLADSSSKNSFVANNCNEEVFGTFFSHFSNDFDDTGADEDGAEDARSNYLTSSDTNHENGEETFAHSSSRFDNSSGDHVRTPDAERVSNEAANETLDPRELRRLAKNLASRNRIANETPEQRQKRLSARYLARYKRLANETPEDREKRLEADKMRQRMKRLHHRSSSYKDESLADSSSTNSFVTNNCNEEVFGTFFSHFSNNGLEDARSNCSTSSDTNLENGEETFSHNSYRFDISNGDHVRKLASPDNVELIII